ncbi:hypothetical protein [Streptomyces hesseae]|uniref:DUF8175 domain-containing protein n=1 Tax=Streptomyces hesseae TaxID=3075519 RepID=A0ABU2SUV1_9ACTN|nr:hypothetical protein [Streptomyces sp. DSM 40473]MDT0452401.1 hypothetical protein [Streptomyces sp. DSM 40473]
MSLGDDGYGGGQDGYGDDRHMTRTRLPEGEVDPYAPTRRGSGRSGRGGRPSSRNLKMVVGVVVLLIAAIAFANRGGDSSDSSSSGDARRPGGSGPTAPTGVKPVDGKTGGIASGFAHSEQGAQSAAANFAVALVSADILKPDRRHAIVPQIFVADKVPELQSKLDNAYSKDFLAKLGLNEKGEASKGMTYVSRTVPVGTKATEYSDASASVEVWCTGAFGTAGTSSTNPVANDWFTMTIKLRWADGDWKAESFSQKDGPAPVNSDRMASNADEIAKAVEQYGGFTYAR